MQERQGLETCINFILNECTPKELEVVVAAVERKKERLKGTFNFDSEAVSKEFSKQINMSIQKGMDGMTKSLRQFSADLIAQQAPELTPEQANELIDSWIPSISYDGSVNSIAKNGKVSGIPVDAMYNMALQFIEYGIGEMSESTSNSLKSTMGNWQEKYWKKFPVKMQQAIKDFFDGKTTYGECNGTIKALLGFKE